MKRRFDLRTPCRYSCLMGPSLAATNAGARLHAAQRGIVKPGEPAPNFQLRDMNGQIVSSV